MCKVRYGLEHTCHVQTCTHMHALPEKKTKIRAAAEALERHLTHLPRPQNYESRQGENPGLARVSTA